MDYMIFYMIGTLVMKKLILYVQNVCHLSSKISFTKLIFSKTMNDFSLNIYLFKVIYRNF